jgi:hypothetical protein
MTRLAVTICRRAGPGSWRKLRANSATDGSSLRDFPQRVKFSVRPKRPRIRAIFTHGGKLPPTGETHNTAPVCNAFLWPPILQPAGLADA